MIDSPCKRPQSRGEEIANSITHGIGFAALAGASPVLIGTTWRRHGSPAVLAGVCIFAGTAMLLYLASAVYHALPQGGRAKGVLGVIDHSAIFLMIAGTYTPFMLGVLRGWWGWPLLGVVWSLALAGVWLKLRRGTERNQGLSLALYLGMGGLGLAAIGRRWALMPHAGFCLLVAGGVMYSAGVPFYAAHGRRYWHFVWHLFVLAGAGCHFFGVVWFAGEGG